MYCCISGEIPIIDKSDQRKQIVHDQSYEIFQYLNDDNSHCLEGEKPILWIKNQSDINSLEQIKTNLCSYLSGYNMSAWMCDIKYPCGMCKIPNKTLLYLKGLCKYDRESLYDVVYYIDGLINNRPHFK